ncbi:shikimate dehydrogenase [bacterium]|nr:shikimate dehydrogenase [bacterium]
MTKKTEKFALIGSNIKHSLSPVIHNAVFRRDGINANYEIIDIPHNKLTRKRFDELTSQYRGLNVTSPFKTIVANLLNENSNGNLGDIAQATGSVNTVDIHPVDGVTGYNTDVIGFHRGVLDIMAAMAFFPTRLILLGAGGVARSVIHSFIGHYEKYSIPKIPVIIIFMRDPDRNLDIINLVTGISHKGQKLRLQFMQWDDMEITKAMKLGGLFVNATPLGSVIRSDSCSFSFEGKKVDAGKSLTAADLVYNPSETIFLKTAKEAGVRTIGGLGMLVYQALASLEIWFGQRISEKGIFDALKTEGFIWIK